MTEIEYENEIHVLIDMTSTGIFALTGNILANQADKKNVLTDTILSALVGLIFGEGVFYNVKKALETNQ